MAPPPPSPAPRWARPLSALVAGLAVAIAAHALSRWPLYVAELWTWQATGGTWAEMLTSISMDTHPPLHPVLVWLTRGLSDTEWAARLPSAAGAVAAAGLLWAALRRPLGEGWAAVGTLSLILSPVWVSHAGIARPYALTMATTAAMLYGAAVLPRAPRRAAAVLAAGGAAGLHLHYVTGAPIGAVLLAAGAAALFAPRASRRPQLAATVAAAAGIVAAFLPWHMLVGRYHLGKTPWESPTLKVLRHLTFEIQDFVSLPGIGIAALAVVGVLAGLWQRRWALVGLGVGAVALPVLLSANQQVQLRPYVFTGMLPIVVLLALHGARALLPRPAVWLVLVVVFQAPDAWRVLRLPSAPFRTPGADGGIHDSAQDMALLAALVPEGTRLVVPPTVEPNVLAHYAPGATVGTPAPQDWALLDRPRQHRGGPGCILNNAFARPLRLPDDQSCARVTAALDDPRRIDWVLERALLEDDETRLALLGGARQDGWATPELAQAHLIATSDPQAAERLIRAGVWEGLRWGERHTTRKLLALRETIRRAAGDDDGAAKARAQQQCIGGAMPHAWLMHRCLSPLTAWSVPKRPARAR